MSELLDIVEAEDDVPIVLDPAEPRIIAVFGKKRSGKSVLNRLLYQGFPGDKVCIDVNGDAQPGEDAERVTDPLPDKMPPRVDGRPRNLHYRADPGSATYAEDLDKSVALVLYPSDRIKLGWFGEIGEFCRGGRSGPHMRRLLHQHRHYGASALFDGPRPKDIDKLVIANADDVICFDLPDPDDREHVAKVAGIEPKAFDEAHREMKSRGTHWFLHYDSNTDQLFLRPPLQLQARP